jgi:hypothetical protein
LGELGLEDDTLHDRTSRRVLSYFVRNCEACDSLEGLVRWQLLEETIVERMQDTEVALQRLVKGGYLIEECRPGTAPLYRMNGERQAAAVDLLARVALPRAEEEP